jgi:hypothetical protein
VPHAIQWQKSFDETNAVYSFSDICQVNDGSFVAVGRTLARLCGSKTNSDIPLMDGWVIKLNAVGERIWERCLGGDQQDSTEFLHPASDGKYVIGGMSDSGQSGSKTSTNHGQLDFWQLTLDSSGSIFSDHTFGGNSFEDLREAFATSDGNYLLLGSSGSSPSGNKTAAALGGADYWVVKSNPNGAVIWDVSFGGSDYDVLSGACQTIDGGYILGGSSSSISGSGNKQSTNYGAGDYWIIKVDTDGEKIWEQSFGGVDTDGLASISATTDNGCILAGASRSGSSGTKTRPNFGLDDAWVVKLDENGDLIWQNNFGGSDTDVIQSISQVSDGGYILSGYSHSLVSGNKTATNYGSSDGWVIRLDESGNKLWEMTIGGVGSDVLSKVRETPDGGYILCGYSDSPASGNKTAGKIGLFDGWIVKLAGPRPTITRSPENVTIGVNEAVVFTVTAVGTPPLTYTWLYQGQPLLGATNSTLVFSNASHGQAGFYSVVVSNAFGMVTSVTARLSFKLLTVNLYAGLTIEGLTGQTFRVEFVPSFAPNTNWQTLTTVTLTNQSYLFFDPESAMIPRRFYRAVPLP